MSILNIRKKSGGQVALIVLLASAILLTLGLSVSKKATTDTRVDTDQELLKQAFNTAESGVDYYLATGTTLYSPDGNKSVANVNVVDIGNTSSLSSDGLVLTNNTFLFWLVNHDINGGVDFSNTYSGTSVKICASNFSGSLKVDYFYKNNINGTYGVTRGVYTFGTATVIGVNEIANGCIDNFSLLGTPLLISVTPIGGSANITLSGTVGNFPSQGQEITSIGTAVGVNSQVKVVNRYKVPSFMLDAITAGGDIK